MALESLLVTLLIVLVIVAIVALIMRHLPLDATAKSILWLVILAVVVLWLVGRL